MITIWHNPRCSKSRETLALIEASGARPHVRRYLEDPPSVTEITAARDALGFDTVRDMLRDKEKTFRDLGLSTESPEDVLIAAMVAHPILIERPIVFVDRRAVLGRPPEAVKTLL